MSFSEVLGEFDFKHAHTYHRHRRPLPGIDPQVPNRLTEAHELEHLMLALSTPYGMFQHLLRAVLDIKELPPEVREGFESTIASSIERSTATYEGSACMAEWAIVAMLNPDAIAQWKAELPPVYLAATNLLERIVLTIDAPIAVSSPVVVAIARNALGTTILREVLNRVPQLASIAELETIGGNPDDRLGKIATSLTPDRLFDLRNLIIERCGSLISGNGLPFHAGQNELEWVGFAEKKELHQIAFSTTTEYLSSLGHDAVYLDEQSGEEVERVMKALREYLVTFGVYWSPPPVAAPTSDEEIAELVSSEVDYSVPLPRRAFMDFGDDDPSFPLMGGDVVALLVYAMPHDLKADRNLVRLSFEWIVGVDPVEFHSPVANGLEYWGMMKRVQISEIQRSEQWLGGNKFALVLDSIDPTISHIATLIAMAEKPVCAMPNRSVYSTWEEIVAQSVQYSSKTYVILVGGPDDVTLIAVMNENLRFLHLSPASPVTFGRLAERFRHESTIVWNEWPSLEGDNAADVVRIVVAKLALRPM